jgi:hypothetical protein
MHTGMRRQSHKLLGYTSGVQIDPAARLLLLDSLATAVNFNEGIKQITKKVTSGTIAAGDYIVIYFQRPRYAGEWYG